MARTSLVVVTLKSNGMDLLAFVCKKEVMVTCLKLLFLSCLSKRAITVIELYFSCTNDL